MVLDYGTKIADGTPDPRCATIPRSSPPISGVADDEVEEVEAEIGV